VRSCQLTTPNTLGLIIRDTQANATYVNPFPGPASLYLLVGGILLGVLMGPAVLGRFAPKSYENLFVGGADLARQLETQRATTAEQLQTLEQIGVTDAAIPEQLLGRQNQQAVLLAQLQQAQRQRLDTWSGWATAIMLAVIAMMMLEALVAPDLRSAGPTQVSPALGRLATSRYALTGLWLALMIAQPKLLAQLPVVFAGLLIVVAAGAALMPIGKKQEI